MPHKRVSVGWGGAKVGIFFGDHFTPSLGSAWILSCQSRLFKGLRGTNAGNNYFPRSRRVRGAQEAAAGGFGPEAWIGHEGRLVAILIFRNRLSTEPWTGHDRD
jgi:hypothetical protein